MARHLDGPTHRWLGLGLGLGCRSVGPSSCRTIEVSDHRGGPTQKRDLHAVFMGTVFAWRGENVIFMRDLWGGGGGGRQQPFYWKKNICSRHRESSVFASKQDYVVKGRVKFYRDTGLGFRRSLTRKQSLHPIIFAP